MQESTKCKKKPNFAFFASDDVYTHRSLKKNAQNDPLDVVRDKRKTRLKAHSCGSKIEDKNFYKIQEIYFRVKELARSAKIEYQKFKFSWITKKEFHSSHSYLTGSSSENIALNSRKSIRSINILIEVISTHILKAEKSQDKKTNELSLCDLKGLKHVFSNLYNYLVLLELYIGDYKPKKSRLNPKQELLVKSDLTATLSRSYKKRFLSHLQKETDKTENLAIERSQRFKKVMKERIKAMKLISLL